MGRPILWTVDEPRRIQLEAIARKLKLLSYPDVMNLAIDEFIAKHGAPTNLESKNAKSK